MDTNNVQNGEVPLEKNNKNIKSLIVFFILVILATPIVFWYINNQIRIREYDQDFYINQKEVYLDSLVKKNPEPLKNFLLNDLDHH